MSTFDVRHAQGDILVHLYNEGFSSELRQILDATVPRYPHGEISQSRVEHLRSHSATYPKVDFPNHSFGPLCVEVLQPATSLSEETWNVVAELTGALSTPRRR